MSARDWEVRIEEGGRGGAIAYRERGKELRFWWEFGGGEAVALINIGTAREWAQREPWAAQRRDEIARRVADEAVRQKAPSCKAVIGDDGWITLLPDAGASGRSGTTSGPSSSAPSRSSTPSGASGASGADSPQARQASAARQYFAMSATRARLVSIFGFAILVLAAVAWAGRSALQIRTTGAPWGASMRAGRTVITLMTRLEPYVPSLNRNHGNDRYTVGVLLHDAADGSRRYVELARGRGGNELTRARLLAVRGTRVWVETPATMLVDVESGRVTSAEEVERDPSLQPPERRFSMADLATGERVMLQWLAAGGQVAGNRWLGVHSPRDRDANFKDGFRAPVAADFEPSNDPRGMYVGPLEQDGTTKRLGALAPVGGDEFYNGALVRTARDSALLELTGGGALLTYETKPRRAGVVFAARVAADGSLTWRTDLGIGKLLDVLPDPESPAFVGERPRIPDKVPEPILVVIDARTGRATTYSLWMKD
ncbi:MAG: hypothetical protein IPP20_04305 [Gemmatimonadetes bacterium]|nr:hypothetical protein [Gemmatimonadota bacterium]